MPQAVRCGMIAEFCFSLDFSEVVTKGISAVTLSVTSSIGMDTEEVGQFSCFRVLDRWWVPPEFEKLVEESDAFTSNRDHTLRVELPQRYMEAPCAVGELPQGVDLQIQELLYPEPCIAQQEQTFVNEIPSLLEFLLQLFIRIR
jgi:hypothetical protein